MTELKDAATRKSVLGSGSVANVAREIAGVGIFVERGGRDRRAVRGAGRAAAAGVDRLDRGAHPLERGSAARMDLGNTAACAPPRTLSADRDSAARRRRTGA